MPKYHTVREVSEIFRRTTMTIYRWIAEGIIKTIKVNDGYLIPDSEVQRI